MKKNVDEIMKSTKKRVNINLHPIALARLDRIADHYREPRRGMITCIIQEFPKKQHKNTGNLDESTEIMHYKLLKKKGKKLLKNLKISMK